MQTTGVQEPGTQSPRAKTGSQARPADTRTDAQGKSAEEVIDKSNRLKKIPQILGDFPAVLLSFRFWETEFDILKPQKNKKGNRLFTKEDLNTIRIIYHLVKEKGYTLQGARDKMKGNKEDVEKQVEVIDSLQRIKTFLLELKNDLP